MNELLEAALAYAEQGLYVFPVKLGVKQSTEGELKKAVRPGGPWKELSTIDSDTIREWFTDPPVDRVLAIDTGKSGIVAVDLDVADGKDGPAVWSSIGQTSAVQVRTPSGGLHDWFAADPLHPVSVANKGEVGDGIDIRGDGGFVFAPPSRDPRWEGAGWDWVGEGFSRERLDTMPSVVWQNLEAAQAVRRNKPAPTPAPAVVAVPPVADDPFVTASQVPAVRPDFGVGAGRKSRTAAGELLTRELKKFRALTTPGSGRSHVLAQELAVLAGHGVDVFWTYEGAMAALMDACRENGFIAAHDAGYAQEQAGRGLGFGMREKWTEVPDPIQMVIAQPEAVSTGRLRKAMLSRSRLSELPDPVPLVPGLIYRESIVVLSGKFGTYKSFVAVALACALATGTEWLGHAVVQRVPVIYAAAEGAYGIRKRIAAWESKYGAVPDDLYLIPLSVRINRPDDMKELGELIVETGAKIIVFDTLHASTPGVDENDSGEMGTIMDTLRTLRDLYGVTTVLPHHTGHGGGRARGSSSIEDDADTSFVIDLDGEERGPENKRTMRHRKSKDDGLLPPMPLQLTLVDGTGSGYVTTMDAYESAAGMDVKPAEVVIAEPLAAWVARAAGESEVRRRLLQVVADIGQGAGLTMAEARKHTADRWYAGKVAGRASEPGVVRSSFDKGWKHFVSQATEVLPDGVEPVFRHVGGERWGINPLFRTEEMS